MANTNTTTASATTVSCLCCGAKCNPAFLTAGYCRKAKCQKAAATASNTQSQSTKTEDQTVTTTTTPQTVTAPVPAQQLISSQDPVDTSKDTGVKVQPKPHAGTVTNPVAGPHGTVQVYTHEQSTAGLIYTPATVVQALEFVVGNTTGQVKADALKLLTIVQQPSAPEVKPTADPVPADKLNKAVERGVITQQEADTVRSAAQTTANSETAKLDKPTTTTTDNPAAKIPDTMPTTYKALTALGGDVVKLLAAKLEINADGLGFAKLCSAVWGKIKPAAAPKKAKTTKKPETEKKPATKKPAAPVATEKKPAPAAEQTVSKPAAPVVHKPGTVLVADGKGGVREATEADLWAALEAMAGKKVAA